MQFKGKNIHPYESFYWNTSERFYRGELGGGISRNVKCDDSLATMEQAKETTYRIRKLTPRECFRLMGVDDADIDKIQASGISNSQQYKCAGNSIVVDTLYHLFRKMFCETQNENLV